MNTAPLSDRNKSSEFIPQLESLRGVAALIVGSYHGLNAFVETAQDHANSSLIAAGKYWLTYFLRPNAAVVFFFVLSGYVVSAAYLSKREIVPYAVRRIFRIYPPVFFSVLFTYAATTLCRIDFPPEVTAWYRDALSAPTVSDLVRNLCLVGFHVNGPTWSIAPEILGSAVLPFLLALHQRLGPAARWLLLLGLTLLSLQAPGPLRFLFCFYAGYLISMTIADFLGKQPALVLVTFASGLMLVEIGTIFGTDQRATMLIPTTAGASLIVGTFVGARTFMPWLATAPLRLLGKISFSFYLLHWPVFYLCTVLAVSQFPRFPAGMIGNIGLSALSVVVTAILSWFSYRFIEQPSVSIGRVLSEQSKKQSYLLNDRQT